MKMIQTFAPGVHPWEETFYDGQVAVIDNIIDIPKGKEHWANELYFRGFVPLEESVESPAEEVEPETPRVSAKKRKVTNGEDNE